MAIRDLTSERLFVSDDLAAGAKLVLDGSQAHYLVNVLRLSEGAALLVFNGRDGEWRATLAEAKKRSVALEITSQTRPQDSGPEIDYLFAPLKRSRLDYMVQKATEMGVARLRPIITARTIAERVNIERMRANAVEAAEQCGILRVPDVFEPMSFDAMLSRWDSSCPLIFCDEAHADGDPIARLSQVRRGAVAVLIGPEGGFSDGEREKLVGRDFVVPISLGPRIMRADTAAVAALALVNAVIGDWRAN